MGVAIGLSIILAGCGGDSEGEYRTFAESEAAVGSVEEVEETDAEAPAAREDDSTTSETEDTPAERPDPGPQSEGDSSVAADAASPPEEEPEEPAEPQGETIARTGGETPAEETDEGATLAAVTGVNPLETARPAPPAEPAEPAAPREIELLVEDKDFKVEGPDGALRVSYDDIDLLKVLNMDPVPKTAPSYFPSWLNELAGRRIRIRGFMYPPPVETGIPAFTLARDNQICCFGRNPKPYDIIPVILKEGVTTDYINGRPFDVVGAFHIGVQMDLDDPTKVRTVYYIDDAIVVDE